MDSGRRRSPEDRTEAEDLLVLINEELDVSDRVGVELLEVVLSTLIRLLCMKAILGSLVLVWNHLLRSRFTAPSEVEAARDIFADALELVVFPELFVCAVSVVFCVFTVLADLTEPADMARGRVCCALFGDWAGDSRTLC